MTHEPRGDPSSSSPERAELEAVLGSEVFRRSARLNQFLRYICEETLAGRAAGLKEYSIATEALGRPDDFDHTRDSIVRVEAHRLRKRLRRFYEGEGAGRSLRIEVPHGAYVPVFRQVSAAPSPAAAKPPARTIRWPWIAATALIAVFTAGDFLFEPAASRQTEAAAGDQALRFSAGHPPWGAIDPFGRRWLGDSHAKGGEAVTLPDRKIKRGWQSPIHSRQRRGEFRYDIPLAPGRYEVSLYFASDEGGARNLFNVYGNGRPWLEAFDVLANAGGPHTQTIRKFADVSPASDGHLHLDFQPLQGNATLDAIEITPTPDGRPRPIRLLAGRSAHMLDGGAFWSADRFVEGGQTVLRHKAVVTDGSPNVYGGERYGDFRYVIPVASGRYRLRLHFAETWFGSANSEEGGERSRVFDVYLNGRPLLLDFDVFRTAGGENVGIIREFSGIEPNPHSQIDLEFRSQPDCNNAMINAIELLPEDSNLHTRLRP